MFYSIKVNEIFKNSPNAGGLQGANGIGKYVDETCGDCVKLYLKIDENEIITEARFKSMGSVGVIVASSVICDLVCDLSLTEAQELTTNDILNVLGDFPEERLYALDYVIRGLSLAIADYYQKLEKDAKEPKAKKLKNDKQKNLNLNNIQDNNAKIETVLRSEQIVETVEDDEANFDFDYDEEIFDDIASDDEIVPVVPEKIKLDAVDRFLFETEKRANENVKENINEKVTITKTTEEFTSIKATRMVEESRTFKPIVETKIIKDEDMPKQTTPTPEQNDGEKPVSKAKALFDSLFED